MSAILSDKKILITRERNQARLLTEKVLHHGGIAIEVPLLKINCTQTVGNEKVLANLSSYHWIFFTSANGVHCFFEMIKAYGPHILRSCKFAVVGHKTDHALKEHGFQADFIPTIYNADTMASEFMAMYPSTNRLLLVRGNKSRDILPKEFSLYGYKVDLIEVYKTTYNYEMKQKLNQQLLENNIDFITFTSPSTVDAFVEMIDKNSYFETKCVCIGTTTEKRAQEQGFKKTLVPNQFTIEGMIERISEYLVMKG